MVRVADKIILAILFIILIGLNGVFISAISKDNVLDKNYRDKNVVVKQSLNYESEDNGNLEEDGNDEILGQELSNIEGLISKEQASQIALTHIGGGRVIDVESEREDGRIIYGVNILIGGDRVEVEVDAETSKILEVEWNED